MKVIAANKVYDGFAVPVELVTDRLGKYIRYASKKRVSGAAITEKDWRDRIRNGDIIVIGKTERVVRQALYKRNGFLNSITCIILRCSWTHGATTVISRPDLATRLAKPTGHHISLRGKMDKKIESDLRIAMPRDRRLSCCDVGGIR